MKDFIYSDPELGSLGVPRVDHFISQLSSSSSICWMCFVWSVPLLNETLDVGRNMNGMMETRCLCLGPFRSVINQFVIVKLTLPLRRSTPTIKIGTQRYETSCPHTTYPPWANSLNNYIRPPGFSLGLRRVHITRYVETGALLYLVSHPVLLRREGSSLEITQWYTARPTLSGYGSFKSVRTSSYSTVARILTVSGQSSSFP